MYEFVRKTVEIIDLLVRMEIIISYQHIRQQYNRFVGS